MYIWLCYTLFNEIHILCYEMFYMISIFLNDKNAMNFRHVYDMISFLNNFPKMTRYATELRMLKVWQVFWKRYLAMHERVLHLIIDCGMLDEGSMLSFKLFCLICYKLNWRLFYQSLNKFNAIGNYSIIWYLWKVW